MAKRTRIIEGTWNCTSCDAKDILARHKRCPNCNNPRELTGDESDFDFGEVDAESGKSLREGVTDDKALEIAGAGEDWFCAFCGAASGDEAALPQEVAVPGGALHVLLRLGPVRHVGPGHARLHRRSHRDVVEGRRDPGALHTRAEDGLGG